MLDGGGVVATVDLLVGVTRLLRISWLVILASGGRTSALLASELVLRANEAVRVASIHGALHALAIDELEVGPPVVG